MGSAIGAQGVIGTAEESTYGTPVTVDRFYEFLSESLQRRNRILTSNGIRGGGTRNYRRGSRRVLSARDGGGDVAMEVATVGFGRWFKHLLGGTPTVAQQGGTAAYLHTYTLGDLTGKALTVQKQLRDPSATEVESFTFHGAKVLAGEFSIGVDQIAQASFTLDAEDVDTSTAAAAASFSTTKLFHFKQGVLKVAGSSVANVLAATVRHENALAVERYYLGSGGLKREPIDNDFPLGSGTLSAEFDSPATFYDRFAADTGTELILEFVGDNIASTYYETFRITVPQVRFTGGTPTMGGPEVVATDVPFEAQYDGSNTGMKIEYLTTDTAV